MATLSTLLLSSRFSLITFQPIQRVCRYPLMFAELLKQTPVCDCPDSHTEIEKVLSRLRETTAEINRATDNPRMKITMEKTWILQDRLLLSDQVQMILHSHRLLQCNMLLELTIILGRCTFKEQLTYTGTHPPVRSTAYYMANTRRS